MPFFQPRRFSLRSQIVGSLFCKYKRIHTRSHNRKLLKFHWTSEPLIFRRPLYPPWTSRDPIVTPPPISCFLRSQCFHSGEALSPAATVIMEIEIAKIPEHNACYNTKWEKNMNAFQISRSWSSGGSRDMDSGSGGGGGGAKRSNSGGLILPGQGPGQVQKRSSIGGSKYRQFSTIFKLFFGILGLIGPIN